jgi:hypothetical protein
MSALCQITDIAGLERNVRKVPKPEMVETSHAKKKPPEGGFSIQI